MYTLENKQLNLTESNVLDKYKDVVEAIYKAADGTWMIDLKPGYSTSYGTNYINCKTKKECIYELENFVSKDDLYESKHKIEEVSRNELLTKAKMQTKSRYERSTDYKGFYLVDVDTDHLLTTGTLVITCRVGKYWDTVELQNVLYWIQYEAEKKSNQVNNHVVRDAILQAIDAMDIKVDCTCADMQYRFAYFLSKIGAKYGKQETRPAKITNPNDYGCLCKHLISMLSNKKWLQQVAAPVMDWMEKRIEEVNRYLRVKKGEELTLPNELARRNAKLGKYSKMFDKIDKEQEETNNEEQNTPEQVKDNPEEGVDNNEQ